MKKILILISIGLLLLNGCGKKPTRYQLENYDESKTISPKKDNKLHGITKRYYGNGKIYQEISYINGKRTGVHCTYTIAGDLIDYETYKDDVLNGLSKKYHYLRNDKTKLKSKVIYKNGKKNGLETIYYENGKVKSKTSYKDGKKNGISYSYNKNGEEIGIETYKNNERNGLCTYWSYPYQQEVKKVVTHYKNDKKEGISISYYSDGTVSSKLSYKNDKLDGKAIYFFKNGKLSGIDHYKNNRPNGEAIVYKKDGTILEKLFFKENEDTPTIILPKNALAQYDLALDYYEGKRGGRDHYTMAFKLYTMAANQGLIAAQNNLGGLYYHGRGIKTNKIKAYKFWYQAAKGGSEEAQINLNHLCKESPWACKE